MILRSLALLLPGVFAACVSDDPPPRSSSSSGGSSSGGSSSGGSSSGGSSSGGSTGDAGVDPCKISTVLGVECFGGMVQNRCMDTQTCCVELKGGNSLVGKCTPNTMACAAMSAPWACDQPADCASGNSQCCGVEQLFAGTINTCPTPLILNDRQSLPVATHVRRGPASGQGFRGLQVATRHGWKLKRRSRCRASSAPGTRYRRNERTHARQGLFASSGVMPSVSESALVPFASAATLSRYAW
jgi:hypothetical protein